MANKKLPSDRIQKLLKEVVEHFRDEDRSVHERQILKCKRLKLIWDNYFQIWYSEVAHDWRVWDNSLAQDTNDQAYYDKPVNILRAYSESIIAALSVAVPAPKCFPENADSSLDILTAKTGDKIGQLISKHNNFNLLWLRALYIHFTEGTVFGYTYPRDSYKYGEVTEQEYKQESGITTVEICPNCRNITEVDATVDVYQPENQQPDVCEVCGQLVQLVPEQQPFVVQKVVGETKKPKSRVCVEAYGGLNVKIANYARTVEQTPYLRLSQEVHYATAMEEYAHLRGNKNLLSSIKSSPGPDDPYTQWGRLNTLYYGEYPMYVVTESKTWLRPSAFNILGDEDDINELREMYPRGVKVCMVNEEFGSAEPQDVDDYWAVSVNPLEDYLMHDPAGTVLLNPQEITSDLISLILQTIEHGIGQAFADPAVLNFKAYKDTETLPGSISPASAKSGKSLGEGFFELKTATLSQEVMPFFELIQSLAQLVSGALPSLFGGQMDTGSNTASEYSMSRAQALQRQQNTYRIFTSWWKEVNGRAIPLFIINMKGDESYVERQDDGSFSNVFIRRAELEGKIGNIELEAAENLPQTWMQIKDTIMKMAESQNPLFMTMLQSPENLPLIRDAIGLTDFYVPGEDARNKQYDEIRQLLESEPIVEPPPLLPDGMPMPDPATGEPMIETEIPSVEVDPIFDLHQIEFEIVQKWAMSEAGREAKIMNPMGYKNVLLHGQMHFMEMQKQMMMQAGAAENGGAEGNPEKPKGSKQISGEEDVPIKQ